MIKRRFRKAASASRIRVSEVKSLTALGVASSQAPWDWIDVGGGTRATSWAQCPCDRTAAESRSIRTVPERLRPAAAHSKRLPPHSAPHPFHLRHQQPPLTLASQSHLALVQPLSRPPEARQSSSNRPAAADDPSDPLPARISLSAQWDVTLSGCSRSLPVQTISRPTGRQGRRQRAGRPTSLWPPGSSWTSWDIFQSTIYPSQNHSFSAESAPDAHLATSSGRDNKVCQSSQKTTHGDAAPSSCCARDPH